MRRLAARALALAIVITSVGAGVPPSVEPLPVQPSVAAASGETQTSPRYAAAAVMPDGNAGLVFTNFPGSAGEIRFVRYTSEHAIASSIQLSTAGPAYPQLVTFQGKLVAAYVDNRSPNQGKLIVRTSTDSGVTWTSESNPFGAETFDWATFAPRVVASRDGNTLYVFTAVAGSRPKVRSTTSADLTGWSSAVDAGDSSMHVTRANNCGNTYQECYRAHGFGFMESATAGTWVYVTSSDGYGFTARGTQVGTLGGSWSTQVDHGGGGGPSGGGESTATTFLDRSGEVIYLRVSADGKTLYSKRSSDGGLSWGAQLQAYDLPQPLYTTAAPVGLYLPGYTFGEYVWFAGWGGSTDTLRVLPLWSAPARYSDSGTVRLLGSAGGDLDPGAAHPYAFGDPLAALGAGGYVTAATDLALPGRRLPFSFTRTYTSANLQSGILGRAWTHSFDWRVVENDPTVRLYRGDGSSVRYTRSGSTYTPEPGVFDVLTKNGGLFTLTTRAQVVYAFNTERRLATISEPAGNSLGLTWSGGLLTKITDTVGRVVKLGYTRGETLSQGRPYTMSAPAHASYPDSGGAELTDGVLGSATSFADPAWVGHQLSAPLDVTIDLGAAVQVSGARGHFMDQTGDGIYRPASVEILTSTDGASYSTLGTVLSAAAINDTASRYVYDLEAATTTRYVRFRITEGGTWTFTSELQVFTPDGFPAGALGTNLVGAASYTKSVAAHANYPDTGGTELRNGALGSATSFTDAAWQGHYNLGGTPLEVTYDLGTSQRVGLVRSFHFDAKASGIYLPPRIELLTSTDGAAYTLRGSTTQVDALNDAGSRYRYELDAAGALARYVRLRISAGGVWLFSSEMQVFAEGAGPEEVGAAYGDRLSALSDPAGRRTTYRYDQSGRLIRVTDRLGNASGQDPLLHTWRYGYEAGAHLTGVVDPDGRAVVRNTFDSFGRLATQKDGLGKQTSFAYSGSTVTITDPRAHDTVTTYDSRSRPLSVADTLGGTTYTTTYGYDDCGSLSSVIDRRGNRADYTFDATCKGNLLELEEPQLDGQTPRFLTTFAYDAKNNPTLRTDALGFTASWTYDPTTNVRLSETRQIDATTSATTKWLYGDAANPGLATRVVAPRGNATGTPDNAYSSVLAYDSQGNLVSSTDADGSQTTSGYDSLGRRTSMIDPDGNASGGVPADHTWTTAYDALDRVTSETDPLNHTTSFVYDGAGNRTSVTDKNGNLTTYTFDGAGRLATVQQKPDPVGQPTLVYTTSVTRDDNGNATAVTQANGVTTDYGYDALDRLVSMTTHPDGQTSLTTSYVLDGNGNVTTRTTADSVATSYTYDSLDRLTTVAASGVSTITYGYDALSRRTTLSDGTGTTTYAYDRLGRLTSAGQPNGTLSYAYDLDSNRTTLTYPGPVAVSYVYSSAGRLSSLTDWASRQSVYTYTAAGLAKTVTLPNAMLTTFTYDRAQRLTNLVNAIGSTTITSHAYTLDNDGNRTALSELVSGITAFGQSDAFGMAYDGLERLTAVTTTNAESFTLDGASNITARTGPTRTFSIDGSNRPTSDGAQSFSWSAADRLTARGTDTFGYDPLDRLTSSTVTGTARTYAYSGDGLLQSRTQGGNTTTLLWDPATSPSRLLVSGSERIVYGLGPLYSVDALGTTTTYARDGQKSIRAELNGTSVTSSFRYRAYGEIAQSWGASTTPALLGYAGQLLDPSGLYYMRARWYDAASARFMSRDPLSVLNFSGNAFAYAGAEPLGMFDPTGLEEMPVLDPGPISCGRTCFASATPEDEVKKCFVDLYCNAVANFGVSASRTSSATPSGCTPLPTGGCLLFAVSGGEEPSPTAGVGGGGGPGAPKSPPKKITGMGEVDKLISRAGGGVSPRAYLDAVRNPVKSPELQQNGRWLFKGRHATAVLEQDGTIVTGWATTRYGRRWQP